MPQVTVSVPHEKLPILKDVLNALGIENKKVTSSAAKNPYRKAYNSVNVTANSLFKKDFGWEYYCNELEFE